MPSQELTGRSTGVQEPLCLQGLPGTHASCGGVQGGVSRALLVLPACPVRHERQLGKRSLKWRQQQRVADMLPKSSPADWCRVMDVSQ